MEQLRQKARGGVTWSAFSQAIKIVLYLVTTAILARLLLPSDFGVLALATIIISFVSIINEFGLGSAIIQSSILEDGFLSSAFWLSLTIGVVSFLFTFLTAHWVALFFENNLVTGLLKGLSITFLFSALQVVPQALALRELDFKKVMIIESSSLLIGSIVAISTAILGWGIWAFVLQSVVTSLISSISFWITSTFRPHLRLNRTNLSAIVHYSSGVFGFNLVNFFSRNSDNFLIGKFLGAAPLGVYSIAYRVMQYPVQNITYVINRVLFPTLSQVSDDNARFCRGYIQASQIIAAALFPLLSGLLCLAEEFTLVLFGAKWSEAVPVIRILVSAGILQTIGGMIGVIYTAKGETRKFFYWGLFSSTIAVIFIVVGLRWGILGVAVFYSAATFILFVPSLIIPFRFIGLRISRYFQSLTAPVLISACMCLLVLGTRAIEKSLGISQLIILVSCVILGGVFYILASWKFNKAVMDQLRSLFNQRVAAQDNG